MKRNKKRLPALIAVFVPVFVLFFIIKPGDEPSDCFLWKVEIKESTFYLVGSLHAANDSNFPLPDKYERIYRKTDKTIFEMNDNFESIESKLFIYGKDSRLPDGQFLDKHLGKESLEKLQMFFDEDMLKKYYEHEAWLLNMAIAGQKSKLIGYDPKLAIDKYFYEKALADNKETIGLDSLQTQLQLFEFHVPLEMQVKVLENAISNMETTAKKEQLLYKAYFENNLEEFEAAFLGQYDFNNPKMKQVYDLVFTRRNTNWVTRFEQLSLENPAKYFVVVGAGHFFGPHNIKELLEKKGYLVKKL